MSDAGEPALCIGAKAVQGSAIPGIDHLRAFVFPNSVRAFRKSNRAVSLLQLSRDIPSATYIRLSKIERGELFARADELRDLGKALGVDPRQLLIDIDDPAFDLAAWAHDFQAPDEFDRAADTMAVLLAAAVRARRSVDSSLTIAMLEMEYRIAPVILSRIENAFKPFDRWGDDIQRSICRLFGVDDGDALKAQVLAAHARGDFDAILPHVANPLARIAKTRAKVGALRTELAGKPRARKPLPVAKAPPPRLAIAALPTAPAAADAAAPDAMQPADSALVRLVPVFGAPIGDGLIARVATGETVEAPRGAGPRAYGLRVGMPSLGPGLPGRSTIVVDPDRFPSAGGLAVVREADGLRLLSISCDRHGRMLGYSEHPNREIAIDEIAPEDVAAVIAARFE